MTSTKLHLVHVRSMKDESRDEAIDCASSISKGPSVRLSDDVLLITNEKDSAVIARFLFRIPGVEVLVAEMTGSWTSYGMPIEAKKLKHLGGGDSFFLGCLSLLVFVGLVFCLGAAAGYWFGR